MILILYHLFMKLLNRDTDYAARALMFFSAKKRGIFSVSELVWELKVPRAFLRKILQQLNQAGILVSCKGNHGGFKLKKDPEKIFLVDLMRIFQGEVRLNECIFKRKICPNKGSCVLRRKICKIEDYVLSELGSITVAALSRNEDK